MTRKRSRGSTSGVIAMGDIFRVVGEGDELVRAVSSTVASVALTVSPKRVARAVKSGKLRGGKTGRDWWVELETLEAVLDAGGWHTLDIRPGPKSES